MGGRILYIFSLPVPRLCAEEWPNKENGPEIIFRSSSYPKDTPGGVRKALAVI